MNPTTIANQTRVIGKPRDWDESAHGPCGALSVADMDFGDGLPRMVSAWVPTDEERAAIAKGGVVFLSILGRQHPVVSLWAE